jgi:hypothetical protein
MQVTGVTVLDFNLLVSLIHIQYGETFSMILVFSCENSATITENAGYLLASAPDFAILTPMSLRALEVKRKGGKGDWSLLRNREEFN